MHDALDFPAIQQRIAESNRNAAGNQNQYPIQEQATQQLRSRESNITCRGT
jgi:hypothetical protein